MIVVIQQVPDSSPVPYIIGDQNIDSLSSYFSLVFDSVKSQSSNIESYIIIQLSDDFGDTFKESDYINYNFPSVTEGFVIGKVNDGITSFVIDGQIYLNNLYLGQGFASIVGTNNTVNPSIPTIEKSIIGGMYNGGSYVFNTVKIKCSDNTDISGNVYLYSF